MEDNEKLKTLYNTLAKDNYEVPDYNTFSTDLRDPVKSKTLYDALMKDNYELPDYDIFITDLGLKKKDASDYGLPTAEVFAEMFKNISKEDLEKQGYTTELAKEFETPNLSLQKPKDTSQYPQTTFKQALDDSMTRSISAKTFKEKAQERISNIDKRLKELPPVKMQATDVLYGVEPKLTLSKEEQERIDLQDERKKLDHALTIPSKSEWFYGKIYLNSIMGTVEKIMNKKYIQEEEQWLAKYKGTPLEDISTQILGMTLFDNPFFTGMASIGAKAGKALTQSLIKKSVTKSVEKLTAAGVEKKLAEELIKKGADKIALNVARVTSSQAMLGGYNTLMGVLNQWSQPDVDFKDIKFGQAFKHGMEGVVIGTAIGLTGVGTSTIAQKARAIPSYAVRLATQPAISAAGLTAESALFASLGAWFEGRPVTKKDFTSALGFLGGLKMIGAVSKPGETLVNMYKSTKFEKPGEGVFEVDLLPWEIKELGAKDYKSLMSDLSKNNDRLGEILNDENIPALTKQKVLWGSRGVGMDNVSFLGDRVAKNGENVDIYNKENVLVSRIKFNSEEDTQQGLIVSGLQIEDSKLEAQATSNETDQIKVLKELEKQGIEPSELLQILIKPIDERTPKEKQIIIKWQEILDRSKRPEEEIIQEEPLTIDEKTFTDKTELFKYLDEVAVDKETKGVKEGWMDTKEIPNTATLKAINEWEATKKKGAVSTYIDEHGKEVQRPIITKGEEVKPVIPTGIVEGEGGVTEKGKTELPTGEEVKTTQKKVEKKLNQQRAIKDDKIFQEQKRKLLNDLSQAEDILLGENKEKARKIEADFKGKDQDFIDKNMSSFYEHDLNNLSPEIEKKLNNLGIKVKEGKLVIDIFGDGSVEVGDIRTALGIIEKGFPTKLKERRYTTGPSKPLPSKYRDIAESYGSLEEAERRMKLAEENLAQANKGGRQGVNKGLVKVMEEQLSEAKAIHEKAKDIDFTAIQREKQITSDEEFMALYKERESLFQYRGVYRNELYDIIEKYGRPEKLTFDNVMPLVIKNKLAEEGKTLDQKRTELEEQVNKLNNELTEKFGRKDGNGLRKPKNKSEQWQMRSIRNQLDETRIDLEDIDKYEEQVIKLQKPIETKPPLKPEVKPVEKKEEVKPPSKPEGKPQRKEGLGATDKAWRAKNKKAGNEIKTDTKEDAEAMAFNEPLPMTLNEDPNYAKSDLNNALTLAQIGRNMVRNLGRKMGGGVRFGMIKRFMRKAEGIFFPDSGIVRIKGIKDFRTLCHEIGHWIDFHIFDMRNVVGAKNLPEKYPDIASELRTVGVKYKGRTYRDIEKIKRDEDSGFMKPDRANILRQKLAPQLKARDLRLELLKKKYSEEIVAGVLQRDYFQKELRDYLIDINYPTSQRKKTEAIAEFIYNYVVDPKSVERLVPKFHAWFEKLLETAPQIKDALLSAQQEFKDYDALDPRAKRFIETKKRDTWLEGLIKSWEPNKFMYSFVNHLQYMRNLSEEWRKIVEGQGIYHSEKDPYISAKAMMGIDGKVQQALLHCGFFHKGNDIRLMKDINGLITILQPIIGKKEYNDYSDYLLALDSRESHQNQRPNEAVMPLDLAKSKIELYEKQYGVRKLWEFQSKIQKYNEWLIDFLVESGKLSKEVGALMKSRHQYYAPLRRVFEEFEIRKGAAGTGKEILATSEKAIWKRLGSERNVRDIFSSMIENTYNILSAGEHNTLNANVKDALFAIQEYNIKKGIDKSLIQEIPGIVLKPYYDVATGMIKFGIMRQKPLKGKILTVWEEGKPKYYDVDAELYNNLFQHEPKVTAAIRFLSMPSRWLQAGAVVYDPTFPVRNILRDQISAMFYSNHGYSPTDFVEGIFSAVKKDDVFQKWMASGGDQSFLTAADKLLEKKYAERRVGRPLQKKWATYTKNPLLALQDFSRLSEIGTRLGAFKNAYKRTKDVNLAAIESRDVSADYGIHGATIRHILPLYPFLNARLQHTRMITEVMLKHPARFFMKGMEITAIGVINWLVNNLDEDARKLYQSQPAWKKLAFFNIRIPGTDNFFPIPKGFLGMLFSSSVESALDWMVADNPAAAQDFATQLFKEYSPIGSGSEIFPHVFKIPMELIANKVGYTNKPIVPESLKLLKKEEQYLDSTPEIYKKIGDWMNISPLRMTYLTRSLFGGAGMGAINILDEVLQTVGLVEDKPDDAFTVLSRMPFTKAFFTETPIGPYSAQVGEFYETLDKITKLNRTVNDYIEKDNVGRLEKLLADPDNEKMFIFYEGNKYAINKFREVMTGIRELKIANLKDDLITKENARKENFRLDRLVHETAIRFKDAWEKGESFNLNKEMEDVMKTIGEEKGEVREEIEQYKNTYNPYWLQLREKDKNIYDLLRQYDGLKNLVPTRKIKDPATGEDIELRFQEARRFNEELVNNYAEEVKNIIGKDLESFKTYDFASEENPEETELQKRMQVAWESALNITKNTFKIQK